jgi:hypothetical protein
VRAQVRLGRKKEQIIGAVVNVLADTDRSGVPAYLEGMRVAVPAGIGLTPSPGV